MNPVINGCLIGLNNVGRVFCDCAGGLFVQSALLVGVLLGMDLLLRRRVRAVFRYWVWMLVLVKLLLPPTLSLPTGIGYWLGDRLPVASPVAERVSDATGYEPAEQRLPTGPQGPREVPQVPSVSDATETEALVAPAALRFTPLTWQAILLLFWLVGVLAFTALLAQRVRFVKGLVARSRPAGEDLSHLLDQCRRQVGIRRQIRLRTSDTISSPAVCGLVRPCVLIPAALLEILSPEGLKAVLIHELVHIKRGDLWVTSVQTFLQVLHFHNPFVWLANAVIRRIREEAVDETVLVTLGGEAKNYSNTLIDIGEMAFWKADFGLRLVGVAESRKALQWRIKHMLTRPVPKSARIGALGTLAILVVAAVLLPMARAEKSSKEVPAPEPATAAAATEKAPLASESDTIVDPETGLKFTVARRISLENEVIGLLDSRYLSPNGRFLLCRGQMVPLNGSKKFTLEALHGADDAAWSPDGKQVAYRDKLAIWLLPVAPETGQPTGPARKLVDMADDSPCEILWSRDLESIVVLHNESSKPPTPMRISVRDGALMPSADYVRFGLRSPDQKNLAYFKPQGGVWTAPVEGGASRLVAGFNSRLLPALAGVLLWWSPDGEWLLCGTKFRGGVYRDLRFVRLADHREAAFKFPSQGGREVLGVSPDGRKLQIYKSFDEPRIVVKVAPIRGGGFAEVALSRFVGIDSTGPTLSSPDGRRWFFVGYPRKYDYWHCAPYVVASPADDPVELKLPVAEKPNSVNTGPSSRWRISPDGKRLFRSDTRRDGRTDCFVFPISLEKAQSTGSATVILKEWREVLLGDGIAWSPDSSRLAICGGPKGEMDLWVVPADGRPPQQLTQSAEEVERSPMWSPDGKYIAYCTASAGQISLYTIPAEGGISQRLWTKSGQDLPCYTWFPDSREIGLVSDDALVAVAIADGAVRPSLKLAEAGFTRLQWFQWSPDGRILALSGYYNAENRTALFHASDKKIEMLPSSPSRKRRLDWTADSQALFCIHAETDKDRPAATVCEVDLVEAWTQAKNTVAGASSPTSASPIAKLEAPPLANGEFRDDFEDGDTKYWTFQDEWSTYDHVREVQNGELVLENTRAILGSPEWTNYLVTVKVCIKRTGSTRSRANWSNCFTGIGFRGGEYGEYCLSVEPGAKDLWLGICYRGEDKGYRTGALAEPPYNFVLDKWYTIQVEVKGPHIVARVDGQPLIDLDGENCPQGAVALIASLRTRVHFDDFSVRLLP